MKSLWFRFRNVPPYMRNLIKADFEFNTWDARHKAYQYLTKLIADRNVFFKLSQEQREKVLEMKKNLWLGFPMIVSYDYVVVEGKDVEVTLQFEEDFFTFYRELRNRMPWHYRAMLKPLDDLMDPERLLQKMLKVGKQLYGIEIEGKVIDD